MRRSALTALALCALSGHAIAGQVMLYDHENCEGSHRLLVDSEPDLDRLDFLNDAEAVRVVSGVWTFFRDVNFSTRSGPSLTLGPSGCVTLGEGVAEAFPGDGMDSVQRVEAGRPPPGLILLYDETHLMPPYRVIIGNETELDRQDFNDRVESIRVVSGRWRLYRDSGFGTGDGPPALLEPGTYPDTEYLDFPHDEASSVMRLPD